MMVPWVIRVMSHYGGLPYVTGVLIFIAMCAYLGVYGGLFGVLVSSHRAGDEFSPMAADPAGVGGGRVRADVSDERLSVEPDRRVDRRLRAARAVRSRGRTVRARRVDPAAVDADCLADRGAAERHRSGSSPSPASSSSSSSGGRPARRGEDVRPSERRRRCRARRCCSRTSRRRCAGTTTNLLLIFRRMMAMTEEAASHGAQVVIWPESTVPLSYASTDFYSRHRVSSRATRNVDVILGSVAEDPTAAEQDVERRVSRQRRKDDRPLRQDPPRAVRRVRAAAARCSSSRDEARARRRRVRVRRRRTRRSTAASATARPSATRSSSRRSRARRSCTAPTSSSPSPTTPGTTAPRRRGSI